jgi:microcystin-dependent protein
MGSSQTDRIGVVNSSAAIKVPCVAATTGAITLSGLQTIDGVVLNAGDRVLVKDQADQTTNGIYVAASTAWTRDADFANNQGVTKGTIILIVGGSTNASLLFELTTANPITIGSSNLTFSSILNLSAISSAMSPVVSASTLSLARTAMGLAIGSAVQAFSSILAALAGLTLSQGDILYRGSSALTNLAAGTNGQVLTSGGPGANPAWATPSAGAGVPTGVPLPFSGPAANIPAGYLICDSSAVSRSTYAALFTAIGTTHGSGNGTTTFNVPDYRGRGLSGVDNMGANGAAGRLTSTTMSPDSHTIGANGGAETHTLSAAESGTTAHTHTASTSSSTSQSGLGAGSLDVQPSGSFSSGTPITITSTTTVNAASATAAANPHTNVPPTSLVIWMIKT